MSAPGGDPARSAPLTRNGRDPTNSAPLARNGRYPPARNGRPSLSQEVRDNATTLHSTTLYSTTFYHTILYNTILYHILPHSTLLHSILLYSAPAYFTLLQRDNATLLSQLSRLLLLYTVVYTTPVYSIL